MQLTWRAGEGDEVPSAFRRALRFTRHLFAEESTLPPADRHRFNAERAFRLNTRLALFGPLLAVVHFAHVVVFGPRRGVDDAAAVWAWHIFAGHLAATIAAVTLSVASIVLLRRSGGWVTTVRTGLAIASAWVYLGFSAWLAGVDQQVSPNVTPFVLGSLGIALTLPMPALPGFLGHLGAFVLYLGLMEVYQLDEAMRVSNQVNGLTISMFGFGLARVLEGGRVRDFANRRLIERQQTALEAANEELQRLATQDGLTGIANRRHFLDRAEEVLALSTRSGRPASLLVLDVDHFKEVNDTRGHAAGDEVLRAVAQSCEAALRATDTLGRTGGEEFAAVLPDTPYNEALEAAERLRQTIESLRPCATDPAFHVTASVGVTSLVPGGANAVADALARADAALYEAKDNGRNRVEGRELPGSGGAGAVHPSLSRAS